MNLAAPTTGCQPLPIIARIYLNHDNRNALRVDAVAGKAGRNSNSNFVVSITPRLGSITKPTYMHLFYYSQKRYEILSSRDVISTAP